MAELSIADFEARVDAVLPVVFEDGEVPLKLAAAEPLPGSPREAGGFRLEFLGPLELFLPQGIYSFALGDGAPTEIFIVPLGPAGEEMRYEAVFY